MAKSTKIIAALGVAGMLGTIAMPTFADGNGTSIIEDEISITIPKSCTFKTDTDTNPATTADGSFSKDDAINGNAYELGTHYFNVFCNDEDGYTVTANVTGLGTGADAITYKNAADYASAVSAKTSGWTALVSGGDSTINNSGDNVILNQTATTGVDGKKFNVKYSVSVGSTQKEGTYAGTVTYTLAEK